MKHNPTVSLEAVSKIQETSIQTVAVPARLDTSNYQQQYT